MRCASTQEEEEEEEEMKEEEVKQAGKKRRGGVKRQALKRSLQSEIKRAIGVMDREGRDEQQKREA